MVSASTVSGIIAGSAVLTLGYLVYFDNKRRNDPQFRKQLKQRREKASKLSAESAVKRQAKLEAEAQQAAAAAARLNGNSGISDEAIAELENDPQPTTQQEKEAYFMKHLDAGEKLLGKGPKYYDAAAGCFFRVLNIYPDPVQLLSVLEQTIPAPCFNIVMSKMVNEVRKKQNEYRDHFPKPEFNCKIIEVSNGTNKDNKTTVRRGLAVTKAFKKGEVIYSEKPMTSALSLDLESKGFCSQCMKKIDMGKRFCGEECENMSKLQFGDQLLYPSNETDTDEPVTQGNRHAQNLHDLCLKNGVLTPLLSAKLLSKMVYDETVSSNEKMNDYSLWDHVDRYHYIDLSKPSVVNEKDIWFAELDDIKKEFDGLNAIFSTVPRFDRFLTEERYFMLKGKFLYNAFGITSTSQESSSDTQSAVGEYFKSDKNVKQVIGAGLYHISAYLAHSCQPNASIEFKNGDSELHLVANEDIDADQEVMVSFCDTTLDKKSRADLLKQKYRFVL